VLGLSVASGHDAAVDVPDGAGDPAGGRGEQEGDGVRQIAGGTGPAERVQATALLDYVADRASGCRVARTAAVQSEMELPFSGLHQLCAPMLDRLERLPVPQRDALRTAFGMSAGPAADRFLVGLAVLSRSSSRA
jgi:hypothetical protein